MFVLPPTHATYFGHYVPSSGTEYMIFKTQNKMHTYIYVHFILITYIYIHVCVCVCVCVCLDSVRSQELYESCKLHVTLK